MKDYLLIALGSLRKRFLRTALTMLGIFIGIAAVVSLVSLGQGMQKAINQQFASVGTDKVIVEAAQAGFGPPGQNVAGKITEHDLDLVSRVSGVDIAAGRLLRSVIVEHADSSNIFFAASLPKHTEQRNLIIEANNIEAEHGRMLKANDRNKILIGSNLREKKTFSRPIEVGAKLLIGGAPFEVVGILKKAGAGRDDAIFMNERDMRGLLGVPEELSVIVAQINPGQKPGEVADKILRRIRRDRHQKEGFEDVTVSTSEELFDSVNTILGVVQAIFIGIAAISLLVGGIGIMNTMYTSVLERTGDIGVMKAIGARNSDIFKLFLVESGLLGMAGGAVGVIIGVGLSKAVEFAARGIVGDVLKASFPLYLIAGALAFSFVVGAVSGVLPARQASKMQPVEALRR